MLISQHRNTNDHVAHSLPRLSLAFRHASPEENHPFVVHVHFSRFEAASGAELVSQLGASYRSLVK